MKLVSMRAGIAALAFAGAAAAVPALAQTDASATLTLVRYELVDLDLTDSVTPWLSFPENNWGAATHAFIFPGTSSSPYPVAQSVSWTGDLVTAQAGRNSASAQAGLDTVWTSASGGPNLVSSTALTRRGFLLSPNTGVTFFFDTQLGTGTGDGADMAAAAGKVTFETASFPTTVLMVRDGEAYSGSLTAYGEVRGADAAQGFLSMEAYTETHGAAAPVPEPAAPAMLLGGLGLLAVAGRRWRVW